MNPELIERILRCPTLPSLPAVAVRVLELTQNKDVSLDALASEIQNDQALAAKVLKTVNSSFYGLRKPCSTISQAMVMLGLSAVKSLALSFSLISSLGKGDDDFDHVAYWRRGIYTAAAAKIIAKESRQTFEDEAFLGGLLQDVGMMALYQGLGKGYLQVVVAAGDHRNLVKHELASMESQHPDIGALLAQRWKLPAELIAPVKYHERPTAAPPEHAAMSRCVGLGNVAHDALTDANPAHAMRAFYQRAEWWFSLSGEQCDAIIRRIAESTRELSSLFRLDTGAYPDADQVIDCAQEHMAKINEQSFREATASRTELEAVLEDAHEYDPLTGVLCSAAGAANAEAEFETARSTGEAFTVIKVSVDRFQSVVQSLGLEAGDAVLFETGSLIQKQFSTHGGHVSRANESGFDVAIRGFDRVAAVKAASQLRERISAASASWKLAGQSAMKLTASVGVATMEAGGPSLFARVQQLISAGERALDAASQSGGDCVRAFVPKAAA